MADEQNGATTEDTGLTAANTQAAAPKARKPKQKRIKFSCMTVGTDGSLHFEAGIPQPPVNLSTYETLMQWVKKTDFAIAAGAKLAVVATPIIFDVEVKQVVPQVVVKIV